jgi:uncharacterized protein YcnI
MSRFTTVIAAAVLSLAAGTAAAHVTLEVDETPANSFVKFVLRVPHGCGGKATTTVRVQVPEGIINVKPMPKAGWTLEAVRGAYAKSYDYYGTTMTEGVREIVWSGGELPDAFYDEFVFRAKVTDFPVGTAIAVPVVQECGSELAERWIEVPEAGKSADDYAFPAPMLTIIEGE